MTHDEAVLVLADRRLGRLDAAASAEFDAHSAGCAECRALIETHDLLAAGRVPAAVPVSVSGEHSASEEIVEFALRSESLPDARLIEIAAHVRGCPRCAEEVRMIRRTDARTEAGTSRRRVRWLALAAAAAIPALVFPAYLGLRRVTDLKARLARFEAGLERSRQEAEQARSAAADARRAIEDLTAWRGLVTLQSLLTPRRGPGSVVPVIAAPAGSPFVFLSVEPPTIEQGKRQETFVYEVVDPSGVGLWSVGMTAADLLERLRSSPEIVLAVPAVRLPEQEGSLRLRRGGGSGAIIQEIPFRVARTP